MIKKEETNIPKCKNNFNQLWISEMATPNLAQASQQAHSRQSSLTQLQ
jgi:hypothetical protein